ncbi:MAG: hypothetical protein ABI840_07570, partial [bacterium]
DNRIKFFSSGNYLNTLNPAVYRAEIKVYEKDERAARKLLGKLEPTSGPPLKLSAREYWYLGIIVLSILIMIIIYLLLK